MLSTRQIELFCALYEEKSVVKAANVLGMSQPNASRLLKDLRKEMDDALFVSVNNRLEPTEYAELVYLHMREVIDRLMEVASIRKNSDAVYQKLNVKIAASEYFLHVICPRLIDSVSEYIEDMFINMMPIIYDEKDYAHIASELKRGRIDFIVHENADIGETLTKKAIITDEWVLISPESIAIEDLAYIQNGRTQVDREFQNVETSGVCTDFQTIVELVRAGVAYGVVPSRLVVGVDDVQVKKLEIAPFRLYLFWRPDRSKDQRLHFLRKAIVKDCSSLVLPRFSQ